MKLSHELQDVNISNISCFLPTEGECWITCFLIVPSHCISDLLQNDHTRPENKSLNQELLSLITSCACKAQHYLNFYALDNTKSCSALWTHAITNITENLQFNETQHFYNLGKLLIFITL